ncbi:hypothetical protein [Aggregatimonas sangjinii]|uniref:hypothetical protein n=1 Tax=Aggregatimonas sangjinii TaxID=2583587 RepID=UPI0026CA1253|nr:hypothetical protein [Aggregatimonas sangjinii]
MSRTSTISPDGIVENYNGNENDEYARVMKFKKSEREMLTIVHTHILINGTYFFLVGRFGMVNGAP